MNTTIKRLTAKILFFILFMFCSALTHAAPQITINNPTSGVSSENSVEIDASIVDSLPTYGFVDWDNSLVGWWRGEGNTLDESGYGHHGIYRRDFYEEDVITAQGKFGEAVVFDTEKVDNRYISTFIDCGEIPAFDFRKGHTFTMAGWIYCAPGAGGDKWSKGNGLRMFYHSAKRWQFLLGNINVWIYDPDPIGNWVHIAVVYDAENHTLSMYRNGIHPGGTSFADTTEGSEFRHQYPLKIGGAWYQQGYGHKGMIDEFMVFNRALSPAEIAALYEMSDNSFIVTYYNLNEFENYTYKLFAVNSLGIKISTAEKTILVDVPDTPPRVVLDYPLDNTREDSPKQTFKCTVFNTNRNTQLQRITFHWDYPGSFVADETKRVTGDIVSVEFTKTNLVGKTFEWNCSAVDTHNNSGFAPANFTYTVGRDEYYVAFNGNDNNAGTMDKPFKTIQKAADIAKPGDTIYIRGGVYRETVIPPTSGNEFAPITFKGYPTEKAVISGADPLTGEWTQHQGSIYKTTMDWDMGLGKNQILVNDTALMEARWPNTDDIMKPKWSLMKTGSTVEQTTDGYYAVIYDNDGLTQPAGYWEGAIFHGAWSYTAYTGNVTSYTPGILRVKLHTAPQMSHTHNMTANLGSPYYLMGVYNALDKAGEWFYNRDTSELYLWLPDSASPAAHTIEAKRRMHAFDLSGKSYITIENIDIIAANILTDHNSSHNTIDNMVARYVSHHTARGPDSPGSNSGIVLNGSYNTLKNSRIDFSSGNGVSLIGENNTVDHCEISNVNYVVDYYATVNTCGRKATNSKIINNKLYNSGTMIITHSNAQNIKILHNEMFNNVYGEEVWDLGITYAIGTDGKGSEIAYNHIYNIGYLGIYFDWNCSNFDVHHNVLWNSRGTWRYPDTQGGIHMNIPSQNMHIYNNTTGNVRITVNTSWEPKFLNGTCIINNVGDWVTKGTMNWNTLDTIGYGLTVSNNINTNLSLGKDHPYWQAKDPYTVYVDYDNHDYHLKPNSSAIDVGIKLGFKHDIEGNPIMGAPDIGAYEFGTKPGKEDINNDGKVNIQDVQACINHISGTQDWGSKADVDGDGKVNENDVREIVNMILNK